MTMTTTTSTRPVSAQEGVGRHRLDQLLLDRILVTAAAVVWVGGTALGLGAVGGGVEEQGGGLFSDHATLIAPAGPAFSIWSVVYVGLAGYVVWQWLPGARSSTWARVTRRPAAAAIALNGAWLLVVFAGWVWASVVVMVGIVVSLRLVLAVTSGLASGGWTTRLLVSGTFGLYLGWICVATCANVATALVGAGVSAEGTAAAWTTVVLLAVVVLVAARLLGRADHRWFRGSLAAAIVWGTAWVSVGRLSGELRSDVVGVAAAVTAVAVAALGLWSLRPGSGSGDGARGCSRSAPGGASRRCAPPPGVPG